jgi:long-chain fatty acid transport protein
VSLLYKWNQLRAGLVFKYGKTFNFKGNADFDVTNPLFNSSKPSDQTMELKLTLPIELIWGISYEIIPQKFLVSFETQYTMWSSYDELRFKFAKSEFEDEEGHTTNESVVPKDWNDVLAIRFGLEYKVMPELAIRAGYSYDFNPVPDKSLDPSLPDSDRHVMNVGFGYNISNMIQLDMSYTYVLFTERESVNKELLGTYNGHVNIVSFTAGFKF